MKLVTLGTLVLAVSAFAGQPQTFIGVITDTM